MIVKYVTLLLEEGVLAFFLFIEVFEHLLGGFVGALWWHHLHLVLDFITIHEFLDILVPGHDLSVEPLAPNESPNSEQKLPLGEQLLQGEVLKRIEVTDPLACLCDLVLADAGVHPVLNFNGGLDAGVVTLSHIRNTEVTLLNATAGRLVLVGVVFVDLVVSLIVTGLLDLNFTFIVSIFCAF